MNLYDKIYLNYKIDEICRKYRIQNYIINDDGSIDVNGSVSLNGKDLTEFPLIFGKITGYFDCSHNQLTSLIGGPTEVSSHFICSYNELTSLIGGPEIVGGSYVCRNNKLTTLEGSPRSSVDFICSHNKLISLMNCPDFSGLSCSSNPVFVIWDLFKDRRFVDKINYIYTDLHLGDGWTIQGDVLEQIAEEIFGNLDLLLPIDWKDQVEGVGYKII